MSLRCALSVGVDTPWRVWLCAVPVGGPGTIPVVKPHMHLCGMLGVCWPLLGGWCCDSMLCDPAGRHAKGMDMLC